MTPHKPKPLPLLETEQTGTERAEELVATFKRRFYRLLCAAREDNCGELSVAAANLAAFQAAEELMETLRGSVRRSERTGK